jgi:hypothetical protein
MHYAQKCPPHACNEHIMAALSSIENDVHRVQQKVNKQE